MVSIRWPFGQAGRVRAPEAKESRAGGVIALSGVGRPRWTPNDYASLAREGYQKNAVAYRCIRMIAEAAAAAPFAVFVEGVRDEAHPLAKLIRRPNSEQSGAELMEAVYGALQVSGNAYVEATGDADGDGAPDELWALRSDRVKVVPGRSGWPEAWDYSVDGRSVRIGRAADGWAPVMHLKLWHPLDDWYGLSPMEAAGQGVDAHNAAGAWNKALLDNAARPSGALVYGARNGERLTDGQFEALTEHQIRRVPTALLIAVVVQTVGGLVWAGGAAARIATLEQRVGEQRLVAERLARLEVQGEATAAAVERIERRLEGAR